MLRVLISAPSIDAEKNVSGVSTVVIQIMQALAGQLEFQHLEIGSEQRGGPVRKNLGSLRKAGKALLTVLTGRFDILHSNTAMMPKSILRDLAVTAAARVRGKPVVLHVHGGKFIHEAPGLFLRLAMLLLFRLSNAIVVLSQTQYDYFAQNFPLTRPKLTFIYNGIELSVDVFGARSNLPGIETREDDARDYLKVAFVGRLAPEKGVRVHCAACRMLEVSDRIEVDIFGDGSLLPEVLALTQEKSFVRYRGLFQPSESRVILRGFDALVLPSLTGEGMPMAVIEAMSAGAVSICCGNSSHPEIIANGKTGLLIEAGSPQAIAGAFFRLRDNAGERRRMSRAAYEFAITNFDAKKNFGKFAAIYQRLCAGPDA